MTRKSGIVYFYIDSHRHNGDNIQTVLKSIGLTELKLCFVVHGRSRLTINLCLKVNIDVLCIPLYVVLLDYYVHSN